MYGSRVVNPKGDPTFDDMMAGFPKPVREETPDGVLRLEFSDREACDISVEKGIAHLVRKGSHEASTVLRCSSETLLDLVCSREDYRTVIQEGRFAIEGDLSFALGIYSLFLKPNTEALDQFRVVDTMPRSETLREIPRVHRPSRDQVLEALDRNTPLIATGVLTAWRALEWTPESVAHQYGDAVVVLMQQVPITVGELVARMRAPLSDSGDDTPPYVNGCRLPDVMFPDVQPTPWFPTTELLPPQLWMGATAGKNPSTWLHRDDVPVFLAQVAGRKRVALFCPDQTPYMYSAALCPNTELIDPDNFDRGSYPLLAKAARIECVLEPGELLVLPLGWYHCVWALTPCISIAHIFADNSRWCV